jgi:hypothetical protein
MLPPSVVSLFINFMICFQVFLDHRPKEEVTRLVTAKTNGATPLVLSCRNGHHEVVQYLVDRQGTIF